MPDRHRLRVGLDARSLLMPTPRGEGRSLLRLYQEIARIRPHWQFVLYGDNAGPHVETAHRAIPNSTVRVLAPVGYRADLWSKLSVPVFAVLDSVDVMHFASSAAPRHFPRPVVVTVHDLIPLLFDDGIDKHAVTRFASGLDSAADRADHVICVSQHTERDLLRRYPGLRERTSVIHWGADVNVRKDFSHQRNSVLLFGGTARRKNTARAVEAFCAVARQLRGITLVVVGVSEAAMRHQLQAIAQRHQVSERVRVETYLSDHEVEARLDAAACLLYVSLYEGFGLPILEAMARGVPVVAADRTSIPEVAGDAALLVDPDETASIANGLLSMLGSTESLDMWETRGRRRAEQFSWTECATKTAIILERISK